MKKKLAVLTIVPLLILGFLLYKKNTTPLRTFGQENQTNSVTRDTINFTFNDQNISASWWKADTSKLKLIKNFDEKLSSKEIIDANSCKFVANAGFYSKDSKPIGLFVADGNTLGKWEENSLLDGILSINQLSTPRITRNVPRDPLNMGVQSGPILKENASFKILKIMNDEEARRTVGAVTGENKLFFLSFYNPESNYSGPLLQELSNVLKTFEEKTKIVFADAINLDGGSASVFANNSTSLEEITPVGAFFCQP